MLAIALSSIIAYAALMLFWRAHFFLLQKNPPASDLGRRFSIIVAFRDEVSHLPSLVESLSLLQYPSDHWEIILVDDHSTDGGRDVIDKLYPDLPIQIINNKGEGKKTALSTGIERARYDHLLLTDADCILPPNLLTEISTCDKERIILGPVKLSPSDDSLFQYFQQTDFAMMQMATALSSEAGKTFLANGANISYPKEVYLKSTGFDTRTASGDDVLFVQSAKTKTQFCYRQGAIVSTPTQTSIQDFIQQRIRWASKTDKYNSTFSKGVSLLFWWINILALVLFFLSFLSVSYFQLFILFIVIKFTSELLLLIPALRFFDIDIRPVKLLLCQPLHILYMNYIPLRSILSGYVWKGRKY